MSTGLRDKTVVVTGGTSGIGLAVAELALSQGASVALCGRDAGRLSEALDKLGTKGAGEDRLMGVRCDVLDGAAVEGFAATVGRWRGVVDLLVNNAGQGRTSTFADTTDDAWHQELDLKLMSQVRPLRAFLPLLRASAAGALTIVNSLIAIEPVPHMVCTSAARAAVQNLAKSLSRELAPHVRVNSVLIGMIESGQWDRRFAARPDQHTTREQWFATLARDRGVPLGRLGRAEEAAAAILFLGSPAASYITGASLEVSGGHSHAI